MSSSWYRWLKLVGVVMRLHLFRPCLWRCPCAFFIYSNDCLSWFCGPSDATFIGSIFTRWVFYSQNISCSFLLHFLYFEKIKGGLWDHLAVSVSLYPPQFLKAGMVEPEEMAVTVPYKHMWCGMMPESQNSAVRKASRRWPLLGNGSVIRSSNSRTATDC
jgi:hypothetical protein